MVIFQLRILKQSPGGRRGRAPSPSSKRNATLQYLAAPTQNLAWSTFSGVLILLTHGELPGTARVRQLLAEKFADVLVLPGHRRPLSDRMMAAT